jgi:NADPH2:quinone reductase
MRAVLCKKFGAPDELVVETIESAPVREGEVRIAIKASGVNFPDVLMVQGMYQMKPPFPFSPGLEVAGDIVEVGAGVEHLKTGDRVMAFINYGGFADEVVAPAATTFKIPDNMPYEHGAAFPIVYGTSHIALETRAQLKEGETLLVLGAAGGVGLTAVELGKLMGAKVIAAASTDEKLALTKEYGADITINYSRENLRDAVKKHTNGRGVDVIYDPVGGDLFDQAIRTIAWNGRYLVIGFASGRIPDLPANRVLLKNASLVGVYWGAYLMNEPATMLTSFKSLMKMYSEGKLKPYVSQTYSLEDASQALTDMMMRRVKGKVVLVP